MALLERLAGRRERCEDELALGSREAGLDDERAIVLVVVEDVAACVGVVCGLEVFSRTAVAADEALELPAGRVTGKLEEAVLELRRGDARQRSRLRIAQPALGESGADQREVVQRAGDPHLLTRRSEADGAAP